MAIDPFQVVYVYTSRKFNIAPKNRPFQKERIVFQPPFFRGYVKFGGCNMKSSSEVNPHQFSPWSWGMECAIRWGGLMECRYGYVADGNHKSTKLGAGFKDCSLCLPLFRWGNDPFWENLLKQVETTIFGQHSGASRCICFHVFELSVEAVSGNQLLRNKSQTPTSGSLEILMNSSNMASTHRNSIETKELKQILDKRRAICCFI